MSTSKAPSRVIDGPYAAWATFDDNAQVVLAPGATLVLGQPLCVDITNLGPDNNVPNNGAALSQCERLVASNAASAGPVYGIFQGFPGGVPRGLSLVVASATNGGAATYTNTSGATMVLAVITRITGWGPVWAGTAAAGPTAVVVGSVLAVVTTTPYAQVAASVNLKTAGTAIANAINTASPAAGVVAGAARVVTPISMVGIVVGSQLLIDSLVSGIQETVAVTAVTANTFTATFANGHAAGFAITGQQSTVGGTLIAANAGQSGIVNSYIETQV